MLVHFETFTDRNNAVQLKSMLKEAGIKATIESRTERTSINGGRFGQTAKEKRVYVFVNKDDYEQACRLQVAWGL